MTRTRSRWAALSTESRNARSRALDRMTTSAIVELMLDEDRRALQAARRVAPKVARVAGIVARAIGAGGSVVLAGAGTSGRLAVIEAAECPPTFGTDPQLIRAEIAGGAASVFAAREGAEDDEAAGSRVGRKLRRTDVLIGVSASSVTAFVRGALAAARRKGAATALVTCARGFRGRGVADVVVAIDTGPEVLTGSTRLKAGSATKAVLNAITTAAMVRLGKTYENLMVDVRPGSAKLRDRARRIVEELAGVDSAHARRLLDDARGEVKTAIVMGRRDVSAAEARRLLAASGGHVRRVVG